MVRGNRGSGDEEGSAEQQRIARTHLVLNPSMPKTGRR